MAKVRYTKELLEELLIRDNAELLGDYSAVNSRTYISFKCNCGEPNKKMFENVYKFRLFCKLCTLKKKKDKMKAKCLEKYGVEYPSQSKDVMDKMKATCKEKYGVENPSQSKDVMDKMKATFKEKYGVENPSQSKEVRNKAKATCKEKYGVEYQFQSKDIKDKSKATCKQNYGVEYPSQSKKVKDKAKATCKEKYGVEHPMQSKEVMDKSKATCKKNYGVEHPTQSKKIKDKSKATCKEKYGVEYACQSTEISEKSSKSSYKSKDYILPSGKIIKIQGYEHLALDEILKEYNEDDIINSRVKMPEIWWKDKKGSNHRYFADIFIPKEKRIIEVKSNWTYSRDSKCEKIENVPIEAINAGYKYEYWIYDGKGNKEIKSFY